MIKSRILNVCIILIGLLFLLFPLDCYFETIKDVGIRRAVLDPYCIFYSILNLPIAFWCIRGGIKNLLDVQIINASLRTYTIAKWNALILFVSLVGFVTFFYMQSNHALPRGLQILGWTLSWLFFLSLLATPVIVILHLSMKNNRT
jgi:hypothetical protein